MYEKQSINTGELPSLKLPKIPTLKEKSPRANLCKLWQDLKSLFKEISGGEHNEVSISQFSTVTGNGEVEVEPCWMMNWGDLFFFVKWNGTYFLKPSKPPKNTHTHTKSDMIEKNGVFFPNKCIHLCLLPTFQSTENTENTNTKDFNALEREKTFRRCFFVSLFWGLKKLEAWGVDSGWWFEVGCLWWDVFFLNFLVSYIDYLWDVCIYIHVCLWDFYGFFDVYGMFLFLFQEASSGFGADDDSAPI